MPDDIEDEESFPDEPGSDAPAEGKVEQDCDGPATNRQRTFFEHTEDAMYKHATLGQRLAQ